jgi:hypothetical protein
VRKPYRRRDEASRREERAKMKQRVLRDLQVSAIGRARELAIIR